MSPEPHPHHIGSYKILEPLGAGGMGEVYLAEQVEPVRRRVAVKVIKLGMDSKMVLARFDAERQALALMDHPGIAKVLDAGTTGGGRPYFVMEYVRGMPLTEYCDRHKLPTDERLELFILLCEAIQHAHQKGVIHRDLKPSNVLVTVNGHPAPKVIDFGIAKAIGYRLTEQSLHTEQGQVIGTPAYMSPEQAEMSGLDVDTRSDIYTLGVMLYELLVGKLPLDPSEIPPTAVPFALREVDPVTPSARLVSMGIDRERIAMLRQTDPGALRSRLKGDLDWIVMRAMEKDRTRRYETVNGLALDIRRHLNSEPIWAGSPSASYRLRKFARRHRLGVTAGAAIAIGLVAGTVLATAGLIRARNAERRAVAEATAASEVSDFLVGLFQGADPYGPEGAEISVREILDRGAERVRTEFEGQPVIQSRLMNSLGNVYESLGQYELGAQLLQQSLALRQAEFGPDHLDVAKSMSDLATLYGNQGKYTEADSLHRLALAIRERELGSDHLEVSESLNNLATVSYGLGRYDEAASLFERALAIRERELGPDDPKVATVLSNLAVIYKDLGKDDQAEAAYRRVIENGERRLGPNHPDVATRLNNLGAFLSMRGKYAEAEPLYQRALAIWEEKIGPNSNDVATALNNLGDLYVDQGDYAKAEPFLRRALAIRTEVLEPTSYDLGASHYNLAKLNYQRGDYAAAEPFAARALGIWNATLEPDHPNLEAAIHMAASVYWRLGQYAKAEPLYRRELDIVMNRSEPDQHEVAETMFYLADNYREQGKYRDADPMYHRSLAILQTLPEHAELTAEVLGAYAESLRRQGLSQAADSVGARARVMRDAADH